jgi:hypothetical protein
MPLWSNTDAKNSAPKYTVDVTTGNTGIQAYQQTPIGTFGVDNAEVATTAGVTHGGWILRTEGSGGRSGRVFQETLVAMGSMGGDTGADQDDTQYVDAIITLTDPTNQTVNVGDNAVFTVTATVVPTTAPLEYQWYNATGDVLLTGKTSPTLLLETVALADSGNLFYVIVSSGSNVSVQSANAELTVEATE